MYVVQNVSISWPCFSKQVYAAGDLSLSGLFSLDYTAEILLKRIQVTV